MSSAATYGSLRALRQPVIETREAATRLGISLSAATKALRRIEEAGLARRVRSGVWALDLDVSPAVLAPYLTAPYPSYISFWSALARHEMIEQIPAQVEVASLARTEAIHTAFGIFSIHRIAPAVFTGFEGDARTGYWARPEKALFDTLYIWAPKGGAPPRFPELRLPNDFDRDQVYEWVELIPRARLRTLVRRGIETAMAQADRLAEDEY